MKMYEHKNRGTCSSKVSFEIDDMKVHAVSFENGCNGNLKALGILAEGMDARELIAKFKGLHCENRGTSCADQFALALEEALGGA